jgi:hypothetical protein
MFLADHEGSGSPRSKDLSSDLGGEDEDTNDEGRLVKK